MRLWFRSSSQRLIKQQERPGNAQHNRTHNDSNADCPCMPSIIMQMKNLRQKSPKIRHLGTIAQLCRAISSQLRHLSTIRKKLLSSNISFKCPQNMLNFGPLTVEICLWVWGTLANFNGFCVLAALLHGTLLVGVSQTLRRWTEGATYVRQGDHQVGHWPTF